MSRLQSEDCPCPRGFPLWDAKRSWGQSLTSLPRVPLPGSSRPCGLVRSFRPCQATGMPRRPGGRELRSAESCHSGGWKRTVNKAINPDNRKDSAEINRVLGEREQWETGRATGPPSRQSQQALSSQMQGSDLRSNAPSPANLFLTSQLGWYPTAALLPSIQCPFQRVQPRL